MNKLLTLTFSAALLVACAGADTKTNTQPTETNNNHFQEIQLSFDKYFNDTNNLAYTKEDTDTLLAQNKDKAKSLLTDAETKNDNAIEELKIILSQMPDQTDASAKYLIYVANIPINERKTAYAQKIKLCTTKKKDCDLPLLLSLYKKYDFLEKAEPVLKENLSGVENTNEQSAQCQTGTAQNCKENYKSVSEKAITVKYNHLITYLNPPVMKDNSKTKKQTVVITCQSGFTAKDNSCRKNYTKTITDSDITNVKTVIKCDSSKNGKCVKGGTVYNTGNYCRCGNYTYNLSVKKNTDGTWSYESEYEAPHNNYEKEVCTKLDTVSNVCLTQDKAHTSLMPETQFTHKTIMKNLALQENYFDEFDFK